MLRLLSFLFHLLQRIAPAEWLGVIGLTWWGYIRWLSEPGVGYTLWSVAALTAALSLAGRALNHMIFIPRSRVTSSAGLHRPLPAIAHGYASGDIRAKHADFFDVEVGTTAFDLPVQIRWLGELSPPHLAVLGPHDLSSTLRNPTIDAEAWSLWYPGSRVRTGLIYVAGRERSGLAIAFLGRRLLLAVDEEEVAEQIQQALESA